MTPEQERFWRRVLARAQSQQVGLDKQVLGFLQSVRNALPESTVADFLKRDDVEGLARVLLSDDVLDRLSGPLSQELFRQTQVNIDYFKQSIPKEGALSIGFDVKNPRMIEGVRSLDTKVVRTLQTDVRNTVVAFAEQGLHDDIGPRTIGRRLQNVVGLAPRQLAEVENFRQALIDKDVDKILSYKRRDARFDSRIMRGDYGPEEIAKWTERYRDRRVAWNAETVARTATLDAMKAGQRLSWEGAVAQGLVKRERLMKQWLGTLDERERASHFAMEKQIRHFDERFSNDQMIPGDDEYNCRCGCRYFEQKLARSSTRTRVLPAPAVVPAPVVIPPPPTPANPLELIQVGLAEAEDRIALRKVEYAVAFAPDGSKVLDKTSNSKKMVSFDSREQLLVKDAVLTHNHPSQTWGLSDADVRFAITADLSEIRAVTGDRLSRVVRPPGGWPMGFWALSVRSAVARHVRTVQIEWSGLVKAGSMTPDDFTKHIWEEVWTRVAKDVGLDYRSEPRSTP